ncbi:M14 metallopeptidase family protein [Glaciecola siphonariae]|uniref:M14 metallopeptidase family protein n=1 Tax=Glaciecola siphonariae TaxID=521012 RepID=A0ABV9LQA6_9ALTE
MNNRSLSWVTTGLVKGITMFKHGLARVFTLEKHTRPVKSFLPPSTTILSATLTLSLAVAMPAWAVESDLNYLPDGQNYDASIPRPADVLGYPVGTWHVRHDQVVNYMRALADASDRVSLQVTGYTHEQRPLLLLTITAPNNQSKVEQMRTEHIERLSKGEAAQASDPLFIYMGYSVHGNEPSGTNASLLVAYHLAASQADDVKKLLNENVVLLDPSLNPDGLSRFAQWANMHKGYNVVADPAHREHREAWPSGRTNHYWFDLNRDWLLLTHPESKARIAQFHQWRPHILTDFHEMGTNSTFFFQPGIPSRKNPWTPDTNVTLTKALANFHAQALDKNKELYFTEESFDDFYYGKGSTYPDAHGSIGILFEQASSRGHAQESINGLLEFERTIQNQFTTSLSTFAGAMANKSAIAAYQRQFYKDTKQLIDDDELHGFVVSAAKDRARFSRMLSILEAHQIQFSALASDLSLDDKNYQAKSSVFIPLAQPQYRLIRSLFSERTRFVDNTFYDVSNWNIGLAFNVKYAGVEQSDRRKVKLSDKPFEAVPAEVEESLRQNVSDDAYAYVFEWHSANAPAMAQHLLENGVQIRVAGDGFSARVSGDSQSAQTFAPGSIMIATALEQPDNLQALLNTAQTEYGIKIASVTSGLTPAGIDLGSRQFAPVNTPNVLLVGGVGTNQYEIGEIWHYLDTRIGLPATLVDLSNLANTKLSRYSHIVFASGRYNKVSKKLTDALSQWVKDGGVLIGQKSAVSWFAKQDWIDNKVLSNDSIDDSFSTKGLKYKDRQDLASKKRIAGAAFLTSIDRSHPLFFGFETDTLPMFKTSNFVLKSTDDPFVEIANYVEKPLAAGYASDELESLVSETAAVVVKPVSSGAVVAFVDNIHFRGYWDGTNKLMANAIYMSPLF